MSRTSKAVTKGITITDATIEKKKAFFLYGCDEETLITTSHCGFLFSSMSYISWYSVDRKIRFDAICINIGKKLCLVIGSQKGNYANVCLVLLYFQPKKFFHCI